MSFDSNIHSRTGNLVKLSSLILAMAFLSACVASSTTNLLGTKVRAVSPSAFSCPANVNLELRIHQDGNEDADRIECGNPATDCTAVPFSANKVNVMRNQWVRWKLANNAATDEFYVIFDQDKSPAHSQGRRGTSIVGSEGGELCLKVNGNAKDDSNGFEYRYSVYVKHCQQGLPGCRPKVLDPIIYVYR